MDGETVLSDRAAIAEAIGWDIRCLEDYYRVYEYSRESAHLDAVQVLRAALRGTKLEGKIRISLAAADDKSV